MEGTGRKQPTKLQSGKKQNALIVALLVGLVLLIAGVCYVASRMTYVPPEYEVNAGKGVPSPEESFMYGGIETQYGFSFAMASNLYQQEDGSIKVYFTNPEENRVKLMVEIFETETEQSLYRSGVILPGEYIEKLEKNSEFSNEQKEITVKIYAFEENTWYSAGHIEISGLLQPW